MSDDQQQDGVIIPPEAEEKFPELVQQILASNSMDTEERNYWLSAILSMSDDQLDELRDILNSEQDQMQNIAQEMTEEDLADIEEKRDAKRLERQEKEAQSRAQSEEDAEDLLRQLEEL